MDLRQLRTFVTVAEQGTVSKASARLGIAQPALSRQIKDLESDLGVRLFDRIRRRLRLTAEGEQLLGDCRGIMGAVGSLAERAKMLRRPDAGVLKVAATPQTIDGVLAAFLARYAKLRPNVRIKLNEAVGAGLVAMLERGEVHIAISTAGGIQSGDHALESTWLPALEFVAAYNLSFAFGKSAAGVDVRSLATHPLLLLDNSFAVRAAFDAACRIAEFKPNIQFESRTPHTLLALAEAGHGIAIVPSVLPTHRYDLQISRLTYRQRPLREGYAIVRDKRWSLPPPAEDFCRALVAYVRDVFPISRPSRNRTAAVRERGSRRKSKAKAARM
jgi:LysR family transcriptional regulator, nitrogen assimilation regulatory protein